MLRNSKTRINGLVASGVFCVFLSIVDFWWSVVVVYPGNQGGVGFAVSIGLALLLVAAVLIFSFRSIARCPVCNRLKSKALQPKGEGVRSWFTDDRECGHCGTDWTPAFPRGVACVLVVFGAGVVFLSGGPTIDAIKNFGGKGGNFYFIWPFGAVVGVVSFFYGLAVLLGKAGKVNIHKKANSIEQPEKPTATLEPKWEQWAANLSNGPAPSPKPPKH